MIIEVKVSQDFQHEELGTADVGMDAGSAQFSLFDGWVGVSVTAGSVR